MAAWEISASLGFVLRGVDLEKRLNSIGKNFRLRPRFDIGKKTPKTLEKVFKEPLGLCSIYRVLEFEPLIVHDYMQQFADRTVHFARYLPHFGKATTIFEGSLEVKLPTIWADEKQSRAEAERRERLEERRSEKRKSQKKEDGDARKGRKVAKHCVFRNDLGLRRVEK